MRVTLRICETCGFTYADSSPGRGRWCPDCREEGSRRALLDRTIPNQRSKARVEHALARTVTEQTLHIRMALHALSLAAWARQLGWDDRAYLDAATEALATIRPAAEALAP